MLLATVLAPALRGSKIEARMVREGLDERKAREARDRAEHAFKLEQARIRAHFTEIRRQAVDVAAGKRRWYAFRDEFGRIVARLLPRGWFGSIQGLQRVGGESGYHSYTKALEVRHEFAGIPATAEERERSYND